VGFDNEQQHDAMSTENVNILGHTVIGIVGLCTFTNLINIKFKLIMPDTI
jgi:hypothetical protein